MNAFQSELRAFFEDLAAKWDAQQPPDRQEVLRLLLGPFAAELGAARAILEVGSGTGALIPCLRERAVAARPVSIDLAHAMLWRARQRCPDVALAQADVHRLPFQRTGAFDLAVCHNSFPHFADMPTALRELARVLAPGGRLFILHDLSREQVNAIHSGTGPPIHHDLLPPGEEARRMLLEAGFDDVWVEDTPAHYVAGGRLCWPKKSSVRAMGQNERGIAHHRPCLKGKSTGAATPLSLFREFESSCGANVVTPDISNQPGWQRTRNQAAVYLHCQSVVVGELDLALTSAFRRLPVVVMQSAEDRARFDVLRQGRHIKIVT